MGGIEMTAVGILNPNSKWAREYNERNGGVMIARPAVSLESRIDFLTSEIAKRQNEGESELAERLIWKRELLRVEVLTAILDEQLPTFGGAMELNREG
jgi:hypothetical protein